MFFSFLRDLSVLKDDLFIYTYYYRVSCGVHINTYPGTLPHEHHPSSSIHQLICFLTEPGTSNFGVIFTYRATVCFLFSFNFCVSHLYIISVKTGSMEKFTIEFFTPSEGLTLRFDRFYFSPSSKFAELKLVQTSEG